MTQTQVAAPLTIGPLTIGPLTIGPLVVDPPVVLAPMAGVTNVAFRQLCREQGAGLYVSEMVSARALVEGGRKTRQMVAFGDGESPRSVQLQTVHPGITALAVKLLVDEVGVDHIDLNFGCPVPKITRRGGGSALPLRPVLFGNIVAAAVEAAGPVPVTVKLRKGLDDDHPTAVRSGTIAASAGAAAVALHARTAFQRYSGRADWTAIAELKAAVTGIPVLGNGDVWEAQDALDMMVQTGCDGVVVGRGCLGRPWLFRDLADAFGGQPVAEGPLLGEVIQIMGRHVRLLTELLGESNAVRDFRKHVTWYLTGYPVGSAVRRDAMAISTLDDVDALLARLDPLEPFPPGAGRISRGHTNGPCAVALPDGWLAHPDDPTPPTGPDPLISGG